MNLRLALFVAFLAGWQVLNGIIQIGLSDRVLKWLGYS
jgi:hypothetical protein